MNGTIASTFPLPPRASSATVWTVPPDGEGKGKGKSKSKVVVRQTRTANRQELDLSRSSTRSSPTR